MRPKIYNTDRLNHIADGPLAEKVVEVLFHGVLDGAIEVDIELTVG